MTLREILYKGKRKIFFITIKNKYYKYQLFREYDLKRFRKKYKYVVERNKPILEREKKVSNKIWICWLQGEENAPQLVKKCINSIRNNFKEKEVIIINNNNYKKYIDMPQYIIEKYNKGIIPVANFTDMMRLELLLKYGGTWIDSTVLCTGNGMTKAFFEGPLFVFKSVILGRNFEVATKASSWFITSTNDNNILALTKELMYEYWKKENCLLNYYLVHIFFSMATEKYIDEWKRVPTYPNINPHLLQFEMLEEYTPERYRQLTELSPLHKLDRRIINEDKNKFTFYDYIVK